MLVYDLQVPRCAHLKTNGTQCGSPALRQRRYCFFHKNWQNQNVALNVKSPASSFVLPVIEDADSIQMALMQVMRMILAGQLDHRAASLLLYALQTASLNLRQMKLEPFRRDTIVIDPRVLANRENAEASSGARAGESPRERFTKQKHRRRAAQARKREAAARSTTTGKAQAERPEPLKKRSQSEKRPAASLGNSRQGDPNLEHLNLEHQNMEHQTLGRRLGMSRDPSPAECIELMKGILRSDEKTE